MGLIIGALGRLVLPGRQNIPIWLTILIGVVAAIIGTLLANALGVGDTSGIASYRRQTAARPVLLWWCVTCWWWHQTASTREVDPCGDAAWVRSSTSWVRRWSS